MTLREIINLTLSRVGEKEGNRRIDSVIKNAVNHSYIFDLSDKDKRITTAFSPVVNGIAQLPDDINTIESISPSLIYGERRIGNSILSNRDVTFTIIYSVVNEPLVDDEDVPELSDKFQYLLSTFACYSYFNLMKDTQKANEFLNEYMTELNKIIDNDNTGEEVVQDVLSGGDVDV